MGLGECGLEFWAEFLVGYGFGDFGFRVLGLGRVFSWLWVERWGVNKKTLTRREWDIS